MKIRSLVILACLVQSFSAGASDIKVEESIDVQAPFAAQAQKIRQDLMGDDYAEISREDRSKVDSALQRMEALLAGDAGIAKLNEADKVQLFNDQELVNAVLTKARDDSRLVCRREKTVGSHRATSQCLTVAERRRLREQSFELLQANQRDLSKPQVN